MTTSFDDPGQAIKIIEALADSTRRKMLLLMYRNPTGLTASNLAEMLRKKIPTILHHLEKLSELDLAQYKMIKIAGERKVKHWKVKHPKFIIEVDMDSIAFLPEDYIITLFEEEHGAGGQITEDFGESLTNDEIIEKLKPKFPNISDRQVEVIKENLIRQRDLEHYLEQWIYKEFMNSGATLQLNFWEFGRQFCLDEDLRKKMFEKMIQSQNFSLYEYGEEGQLIQRLALRQEYYEAHKDDYV
ncbi:MAG: winged helix-turn-helix domain-containing protein [Candidatus Hermodarchaeota archaeon]